MEPNPSDFCYALYCHDIHLITNPVIFNPESYGISKIAPCCVHDEVMSCDQDDSLSKMICKIKYYVAKAIETGPKIDFVS